MKWHPGKGNSNMTMEFQWFLPPHCCRTPSVVKMVKSMQKTKVLFLVILANMAIWLAFNRPAPLVSSWTDKIEGVSFSPFHKGQNPMEKIYPFPDQIDGDLKMIRGVTRSVRSCLLYTSPSPRD